MLSKKVTTVAYVYAYADVEAIKILLLGSTDWIGSVATSHAT